MNEETLLNLVMDSLDMTRYVEDQEIKNIIDRVIVDEGLLNAYDLETVILIKKRLFNSIRGLDILSELMEDDSITEIMINAYDSIFIEKAGRIKKYEKTFSSQEKLLEVIQQIVASCNRVVNETSPIVDARLRNGSRVNVILPPIALDGPKMTIRKFAKKEYSMNRLIGMGSISSEAANFLRLLVVSGYNIFISGGTGAGKTTFLNALSEYIPETERIITIEDCAELQIKATNIVRLETRNANIEGENAITIRDLIKTSLRARPDRIIVGEIRDGAALDMISAMNTGHDGSLSTGHANSCEDMIMRMETMMLMAVDMPLLAIRQQIATAIDIVVHVERLRDRSRHVTQISEVIGIEDGRVKLKRLYSYVEDDSSKDMSVLNGHLKRVDVLENMDKLSKRGYKYEFEECGL